MSERNRWTRVTGAVLPSLLLVLVMMAPPALGATIYVDINATCVTDCNGSSWCNAYKDLAGGLGAAHPLDEVLVADGTYHGPGPTLGFTVESGITLKGGYAGCSDPTAPRNIVAYEAILDGDWAENDDNVAIECVNDSDCTAVSGQGDTCANGHLYTAPYYCDLTSENSRHVVSMTGPGTGDRTIDGFTITAGNDIGASTGGGGIIIDTDKLADVAVKNCLIVGNFSDFNGGGIGIHGESRPVIDNCEIRENTCRNEGGGIATIWRSGTFQAQVEIINCVITDNLAKTDGGGVYVGGNSSSGYTNITNTLLARNIANWECAAVDATGASVITNCTIVDNEVHSSRPKLGGVCTADDVTIANSILWGTVRVDGGQRTDVRELLVRWPTTVTYSDLEGGDAGVFEDGSGEVLWEGRNIGENDATQECEHCPNFVDAAQGDYRLLWWSPAMDAASNFNVPADVADLDGDGDDTEPIEVDLDWTARFVDAPNPPDTPDTGEAGAGHDEIVDMGAYEWECPDPSDVVKWESVNSHGLTIGDVGLVIESLPVGYDDFSEPRYPGVDKLVVTYSAAIDPATATPAAVGLVGNGLVNQPMDLSNVVIATTLTAGDTQLVITLTDNSAPPLPLTLPDLAKYRFTLTGIRTVSGCPTGGTNTVVVTALRGDADGNLMVLANDVGGVSNLVAIVGIDPNIIIQVRSDGNGDGNIFPNDVGGISNRVGNNATGIPDP